jgi:hypothetical protein
LVNPDPRNLAHRPLIQVIPRNHIPERQPDQENHRHDLQPTLPGQATDADSRTSGDANPLQGGAEDHEFDHGAGIRSRVTLSSISTLLWKRTAVAEE